MKTITLGFGYTQNIGEYESWKVYQEVEVEPDENPDEAFAQLKDRVKGMLLRPNEMRGVEQELAQARERKEELNRKIWDLEQKHQDLEFAWKTKILPKWKQAKTILTAHGIEISKLPSIEFNPEDFKDSEDFEDSEDSDIM